MGKSLKEESGFISKQVPLVQNVEPIHILAVNITCFVFLVSFVIGALTQLQ